MKENARPRGSIGARISIVSLIYIFLACIATYLFPEIFMIRIFSNFALKFVGLSFLCVGAPIFIISLKVFLEGSGKGQLVTTSFFSIVRNPIYASWILFLLPGFAILCRSWLMLGTSIIAYIFFRLFIKEEDDWLQEKFGQAYLDYKSRVNELFPFPRLQQ
jgi:protein-S-isoprenylcysteine O-methyltransferase Ste14